MSKKLKHDKIIRSAFENPFVAREFFEMHLPPHIKDSLIFETLKMEKDSFIEPSLKESILDILFSAKFDGEDGYLFLLLAWILHEGGIYKNKMAISLISGHGYVNFHLNYV